MPTVASAASCVRAPDERFTAVCDVDARHLKYAEEQYKRDKYEVTGERDVRRLLETIVVKTLESFRQPRQEQLFRILMADKNGKAVLINIFGGILRCDVLAQGVIAAVTELGVPVPIVIRMEGTNVEEGKRLLRESGLNFTTADSMGEAAEKVVGLARR